ncbi:MAG TPA: hypothetical protein VN635_01805 [Conexibacter sp.]|nr:hypothetical protein [Conexibacter sp.]
MTLRWARLLAVVAISVLGLIFSIDARSEPSAVSSPLDKSQALVESPSPAVGVPSADVGPAIEPAAARDVARGISEAEVPLPPGLNTAAALDWQRQSDTGPITAGDVRSLLQANAARDWVWYATHATLTPQETTILEQIPEWPALRGNALGEIYQGAIARILAGDREYGQAFAARQFRERGGEPARDVSW